VHVLLLAEVGRLSLRAGGLLSFGRAVGDHVADALAEVAFLGLRRQLALFGMVVQPAAVVASAGGGERFEEGKQKERTHWGWRWPWLCFPVVLDLSQWCCWYPGDGSKPTCWKQAHGGETGGSQPSGTTVVMDPGSVEPASQVTPWYKLPVLGATGTGRIQFSNSLGNPKL